MVTRGDTIADRLTHPHNANVGNFNFRQDAIDFKDYDSFPLLGKNRCATGIPKLPANSPRPNIT